MGIRNGASTITYVAPFVGIATGALWLPSRDLRASRNGIQSTTRLLRIIGFLFRLGYWMTVLAWTICKNPLMLVVLNSPEWFVESENTLLIAMLQNFAVPFPGAINARFVLDENRSRT